MKFDILFIMYIQLQLPANNRVVRRLRWAIYINMTHIQIGERKKKRADSNFQIRYAGELGPFVCGCCIMLQCIYRESRKTNLHFFHWPEYKFSKFIDRTWNICIKKGTSSSSFMYIKKYTQIVKCCFYVSIDFAVGIWPSSASIDWLQQQCI